MDDWRIATCVAHDGEFGDGGYAALDGRWLWMGMRHIDSSHPSFMSIQVRWVTESSRRCCQQHRWRDVVGEES